MVEMDDNNLDRDSKYDEIKTCMKI